MAIRVELTSVRASAWGFCVGRDTRSIGGTVAYRSGANRVSEPLEDARGSEAETAPEPFGPRQRAQ